MATTNYEDKINNMYDSQLTSEKAQLQTNYEVADANLMAQQEAAAKALAKNISLTKAEAQKAAVGNEEYYNAAGLSSGARAQARLAQDNQLLSNITTLRAAQQQTDADIIRKRDLLAKEYASAIAKAQADNDLLRAQTLYAEAKEADEKLLAQQETAAGLMAQAGDYSRYGELYGLTPDEIAKLSGSSTGGTTGGTTGGSINNGNYGTETVKAAQRFVGATDDGLWGPNSMAKAKEANYNSLDDVVAAMGNSSNGWSATYNQVKADMRALIYNPTGSYEKAMALLEESKPYLSELEYWSLATQLRDDEI